MSETTLRTEHLQLEGFHCADCAVTIEKTVAKVNGVASVQANFAAGKVKIRYNPFQVRLEELIHRVENIGYRVQTDMHQDIEAKTLWRNRELYFTLLSGCLLFLGLGVHFFTSDPKLVAFMGRGVHVSTILYLLAVVLGAYFFSREGWASVKSLRFNMDFLMSLAIIGAVIIAEYVEAASLAFLLSLAELLEGYAVDRARNSLRQLIQLAPSEARVVAAGQECTRNVSQIEVGDILAIRPGEKIALDGKVVKGVSSVDQSPITGESRPVAKTAGEKVFAGSINIEGYLEVKVTELSSNTMLARIIHMVEEAEAQKAPSQKFVDRFARIYTPAVVLLAVAVATIPPLFLGGAFNPWFIKALTLLVIACPCALVISTPVTVVSALTSASRSGVLIKGGVYLEEMAKVKVIALDKTGTLTRGKLEISEVVPLNGRQKEDVLKIAAALESRSEHHIARAIVNAAVDLPPEPVHDFESIPGKGVTARFKGVKYYLGRPELFRQFEVELPASRLHKMQRQGKTTMLVGTQSEILGIVALSDQLRSEAVEMITKLRRAGKEVVMITGDNEETARAIAQQLGITHFHAGLLPEEKVAEIRFLQKKYGKVAMIGDGINDAPALAAASVGIAMGVAGTDTALETADIALMSDELSKIPYLVELSKKGRLVIQQNIWTSLLLKLTLAVGVFPGIVSLVLAILIGDMGASFVVTSNALRLARVKSN